MNGKRSIELKLQQVQIPDVWDKIKDVPLSANNNTIENAKKKTYRIARNRFVPMFAGIAACFIVLFGFLIVNNSDLSNNPITGGTGHSETTRNETEMSTISQGSTGQVETSGVDVIVWNETENAGLFSDLLGGRMEQVTQEEWRAKFPFAFAETIFGEREVGYLLLYSWANICDVHFRVGIDCVLTLDERNVPADRNFSECCSFSPCIPAGVIPTMGLIFVRGADETMNDALITVREVTPVCGTLNPDNGMWINGMGIESSSVSLSTIGGVNVLLAKSNGDSFELRTHAVFDVRGHRITFSGTNFTKDVVLELIRILVADNVS
jgi:hypothetical protein